LHELKTSLNGFEMFDKKSVKEVLTKNERLMALGHWFILRHGRLQPRWWVRKILNRFYHKIGKNTIIRSKHSRHDLFPWNKFEIGNDSDIENFTVLNNGAGDVILGNRVLIGIGSVIIGPVTMGDGSGTGQHVFISGFSHGFQDPEKETREQPLEKHPVVMGEDVHIGSNSVVVAGVTIGKKTQIGAGSVVTRDIPPYSVAVGNPAKVVKRYNFETKCWENTRGLQ